FQTFFQQARDGALARSDRAVQKQDALFRAVALRRRLEEVDQRHQRLLQPVDRIRAALEGVAEELVAVVFLLELREVLRTVREDHVVDALKRIARHAGVVGNDIQVVPERPLPVLITEVADVQATIDQGNQWIVRFGHVAFSAKAAKAANAAKARARTKRACGLHVQTLY